MSRAPLIYFTTNVCANVTCRIWAHHTSQAQDRVFSQVLAHLSSPRDEGKYPIPSFSLVRVASDRARKPAPQIRAAPLLLCIYLANCHYSRIELRRS